MFVSILKIVLLWRLNSILDVVITYILKTKEKINS